MSYTIINNNNYPYPFDDISVFWLFIQFNSFRDIYTNYNVVTLLQFTGLEGRITPPLLHPSFSQFYPFLSEHCFFSSFSKIIQFVPKQFIIPLLFSGQVRCNKDFLVFLMFPKTWTCLQNFNSTILICHS